MLFKVYANILEHVYEMDHFLRQCKPWGHYAKWNKPVTKGQILYDST